MDKQSRERDKITHGFKIKRALKNGLFYGLALEVMAITGGYLVYKEYKSNEEFRQRVEDQFPELTQAFNAVTGIYLKAMPKSMKDRLLDVNGDEISTNPITNPPNQSNATASTPSK